MNHVRFFLAVCFVCIGLAPTSSVHAQQKVSAKSSSGKQVSKVRKTSTSRQVIAKNTAVNMDKRPVSHTPEPAPWATPSDSSGAPALPIMSLTPVIYQAPIQQNPYLLGYVRTSPETIIAIPLLVAIRADGSLTNFLRSIENYPARVVDRLPSVKTVYPTGSKAMKVISLACPAEVVTGSHFAPFDALRTAGNKVFEGINSANVFPHDLMLVCT
jgi:hypothetical protein